MKPLIELKDVCQTFYNPDGNELHVLDHISFSIHENEIVALVGKSGSGKSTLLRIMSGLIAPTRGQVSYLGEPVTGPVSGLSMVFQNFALMPWLTVLQNVELGLEAQGVPRDERRQRALKAIDTIGLDGFESAFPRELSGGMRQRVGFARALVVDPDVLLMDEPFSALDMLTAENLRTDLLDLWEEKQTRIKGIMLVTHSIEEAVNTADRIIILQSDPGRIQAQLSIDIPRPRNENDPRIDLLFEEIYRLMTSQTVTKRPTTVVMHKSITLDYRLPDVEVSELTGLLESLAHEREEVGPQSLSELADTLHMGVDDLFPLVEMLDILRFALVHQGTIELTEAGKAFAQADILEKKEIFARHLINYVPLVRHIRHVLDERPEHRANQERFTRELEDKLSEQEADRVLKTIIEWGRYAELFAYDQQQGALSLENPG